MIDAFDKKRPEAEQRIYRKYSVKRLRDRDGKHRHCEFFVLDWRHDRFAVPAMLAYADACAAAFPALASDLREKANMFARRWANEDIRLNLAEKDAARTAIASTTPDGGGGGQR